jgi:protein-L-isoaspartate(D-aspartate) O-methyltransferase
VEVAPGRFLLDPRTFAKLLMLSGVGPQDRVLDVGCATGYSTAVLARLAQSVIGLEQDTELVRLARDILPTVGSANANVLQGVLCDGMKSEAPYDVIVVEGGMEEVPLSLLSQLSEGGRLVGVIQRGAQGRAHIFVREKGCTSSRADFDASVPILAGFRVKVGFVF